MILMPFGCLLSIVQGVPPSQGACLLWDILQVELFSEVDLMMFRSSCNYSNISNIFFKRRAWDEFVFYTIVKLPLDFVACVTICCRSLILIVKVGHTSIIQEYRSYYHSVRFTPDVVRL
jgi:hypothetical protein